MISNRVIQEMLETEMAYQNSLALFVDAGNEPFYAEGPEIFQRLTTAINKFAYLSDSLHYNASVEMTQELNPTDLSELRAKRMILIGDFFTEFKTYMSLYEEFLKTKYNAKLPSETLPFKQLDEFLKSKSPNNSDSILIQPLQRGPRYELLIKDVLKRDDELSVDAPNKLIPAAREQLELLLATTRNSLVEATKREETPGYRFGDISRGLLRRGSEILFPAKSSSPVPAPVAESAQASGYKFGDYTRSFGRRAISFWSAAPVEEISSPVLISSSYNPVNVIQIPSAEPPVRIPPALPPRDLSPENTVLNGTDDGNDENDTENSFTII
ncbi:RhoGEF domain-containing protein [Legionella quateirensis]|uniref:RhoGEF domain n=1 Tax=Legionella quateirensis TaxID=45072 RepID=A0A378KYI6_9GAMM|nr:RhoGEF domain-containing protein [Legionella quateirensis]KTD45175.1 RhoGEF domain protein [Legionella quateirensis]STY18428.1 RhoGEF domain [Legionella quateirensis]